MPNTFPIYISAESSIDIEALDIPVNAVATALKDFFSKHLPPLFDKDLMSELEEIAGEFNVSFCVFCKNVYAAHQHE